MQFWYHQGHTCWQIMQSPTTDATDVTVCNSSHANLEKNIMNSISDVTSAATQMPSAIQTGLIWLMAVLSQFKYDHKIYISEHTSAWQGVWVIYHNSLFRTVDFEVHGSGQSTLYAHMHPHTQTSGFYINKQPTITTCQHCYSHFLVPQVGSTYKNNKAESLPRQLTYSRPLSLSVVSTMAVQNINHIQNVIGSIAVTLNR